MLFTSDYSMKMPLSEALLTSLVGITTVIFILAVIACLILLVSKIIRGIEGKASKNSDNVKSESENRGVPMPEGMNQGELELYKTDEKTAAIIMAIVSDKSGIPLNRLSFKSIRLLEDEKK